MKIKGVFFVPLIAFLFAGLVFSLFIIRFDNYGSCERLVQVMGFFDEAEEDEILFIGDSQIREDIDCTDIDENCFNLGVAGILPTQLIFLEGKIISSDPEKVVLGVSPLFFNEEINMNLDYYYVLSKLNQINDKASNWLRLNKKEKIILNQNPLQKLNYKRKFILPFFLSFAKRKNADANSGNKINNFKDPFLYTIDKTEGQIKEKVRDERILSVFRYENMELRQKEAFLELIEGLHNAKIDVVVIAMPLNPILLEKIDMTDFNEFLLDSSKKLGFELKDFQGILDEKSFTDISHLNAKGRKELSLMIKGDKDII